MPRDFRGWRAPFRRLAGHRAPPRPSTQTVDAPGKQPILIASIGEPFPPTVIERAIALGERYRPTIHVLSTARIWGTAFGLQHPGLYPSRREWAAQKDIVREAAEALRARGFDAKPFVIATRNPSKVIAREAERLDCQAIVIGVRPLSRWRKILLQDEAARLRRRARMPVYLTPLETVDKLQRSGLP